MLTNLLKTVEKIIEKCNFYTKYFGKIKCYADRPYLVLFSELKPETHIYIFWPYRSIVWQLVWKTSLMTKPTMWLCAQRRLRSAWASAQSDQSLRCALSG